MRTYVVVTQDVYGPRCYSGTRTWHRVQAATPKQARRMVTCRRDVWGNRPRVKVCSILRKIVRQEAA